MKPSSPCLKCTKRHSGCHSKCFDYINYKDELEDYNVTKRTKKEFEADYYAFKNRKFR